MITNSSFKSLTSNIVYNTTNFSEMGNYTKEVTPSMAEYFSEEKYIDATNMDSNASVVMTSQDPDTTESVLNITVADNYTADISIVSVTVSSKPESRTALDFTLVIVPNHISH